MSALSNYTKEKLLNQLTNNEVWSPPANLYLALFDAADGTQPLEQGLLGHEFTDKLGYNRKLITFPIAQISNNEATTVNTDRIEFDAAGEVWGNVAQIAIIDTATPGTGNVLYWRILGEATWIDTDDAFVVPASAVQLRIL